MSNKELIIFDLDDTLVDTSDVYWRARSAFVKKLVIEGINEEEVVKEFERIDSINMRKLGFDPNRYEKSMLNTYKHFFGSSKHCISDETFSYIKSCSRLILEDLPKLIDGAEEILQWTSKHYKLAILTRGEESFQRRKLKKSGMYDHFDFIRVVPKKDANVFSEFLQDIGYPSKNTWVIGDSIKSDINPGIEVGAKCIFYAYKHPHYYWIQDYECYTLGSFYKVSSLYEIRRLLESPSDFNRVTEV